MGLQYFTLVHVFISMVGITAGFGAVAGLIAGKLFPRWTALFLATTMATSVTGFFFPFNGITPGIIVGAVSVLALALGGYGLYFQHLSGVWRKVFVITTVLSLYMNVFVLVVQLFQKMPALAELAPTQSEPPFAITQAIVFVSFVWIGVLAVRRFRASV